jgi:hypothetical protein
VVMVKLVVMRLQRTQRTTKEMEKAMGKCGFM